MDMLKEYYKKVIKEYPQHKEAIDDYYQLALDEIEEGNSPDNEFRLFVSEVESIVNEEHDDF
jgi:hypothetical protein